MIPSEASRILSHVVVVDQMIVLDDATVAREVAHLFSVMNRDWWASAGESYIYNEFADVLREGFRLGCLRKTDLFEDDAHVLECLYQAKSPLIAEKLDKISRFKPEYLVGFVPKVVPKTRWLDPAVKVGAGWRRLSEILPG